MVIGAREWVPHTARDDTAMLGSVERRLLRFLRFTTRLRLKHAVVPLRRNPAQPHEMSCFLGVPTEAQGGAAETPQPSGPINSGCGRCRSGPGEKRRPGRNADLPRAGLDLSPPPADPSRGDHPGWHPTSLAMDSEQRLRSPKQRSALSSGVNEARPRERAPVLSDRMPRQRDRPLRRP